jgi:translation initiation factor IF-3
MVIAPLKNKSEAKAEQNARRAEEKASRRSDKSSETETIEVVEAAPAE